MLRIQEDLCKKCRICMKNCPIGAIVAGEENGEKYVRITDKCVECNICRRVCPFGVIENDNQAEGVVQCSSCSVQCKIPVGSTGACKRYTNEGGKLVRNRALVVEPKPQVEVDEKIRKPIITAVGAGTNYPCIRPAPHIVCENRDGVDVVTTVTEAPLSYSGVLVKLDTNTYIGEEGATVYCEGKPVGMVQTEEYGSKMIYVGGANRLTAKDGGFATARTIVALANGEEVELTVRTEDKKAIKSVDMSVAHAGMTILVTNTTGEIAALFEVQEDGGVKEIPMTEKAAKVVKAINENCQGSMTSVMYCGGTGGSARGGVCKHPVKITEAVHDGIANLTIGGAPAFVYPGGGINFIVDTAKVVNKAFTWVPTPATVAPVEYTMTKADYEKMGGHMDQIKNVEDFPEYRK